MRPGAPVPLVARELDRFRRPPAHEPVGAVRNGRAVLGRLEQVAVRVDRGGKQGQVERVETVGVRLREGHPKGLLVERLGLLEGVQVLGEEERLALGIGDSLEGEDRVLRRHRRAVLPDGLRPQVQGDDPLVRRDLPAVAQPADRIHRLVEVDQVPRDSREHVRVVLGSLEYRVERRRLPFQPPVEGSAFARRARRLVDEADADGFGGLRARLLAPARGEQGRGDREKCRKDSPQEPSVRSPPAGVTERRPKSRPSCPLHPARGPTDTLRGSPDRAGLYTTRPANPSCRRPRRRGSRCRH